MGLFTVYEYEIGFAGKKYRCDAYWVERLIK